MLINPEGGNLIVFDFNKPKIEITEISEDKKFGRFVVEPLERGYGTRSSAMTFLFLEASGIIMTLPMMGG